MEHGPSLVALTVKPVACQGMADRGEVDPDLMRPSGPQRDREKRAARRCAERMDVGDRALSPFAHGEGDRAVPQQRRIDGLLLLELSFAEREVELANAAGLELPGQLCVDVGPGTDSGCYEVWISGNAVQLRPTGLRLPLQGVLQKPNNSD